MAGEEGILNRPVCLPGSDVTPEVKTPHLFSDHVLLIHPLASETPKLRAYFGIWASFFRCLCCAVALGDVMVWWW